MAWKSRAFAAWRKRSTESTGIIPTISRDCAGRVTHADSASARAGNEARASAAEPARRHEATPVCGERRVPSSRTRRPESTLGGSNGGPLVRARSGRSRASLAHDERELVAARAASTRTTLPSGTSSSSKRSASGSWRRRWMARLRGRAPKAGRSPRARAPPWPPR